jgi:WS/DGAT/MGAT family acyltransferase
MDGEAGIGLSEILMDLSPDPARNPQVPEDSRETRPRRPALWEMGRAALANGLQIPKALAVHSRRVVADGLSRVFEADSAAKPPRVPRVPFNGRLTRQRAFAFASLPLGPLRDAKKHFDVTMNDVLLEIVASSLRHVLIEQGDLPDAAVVGLCPVSLRRDGDQSFGNQISSMPVSLATHLEDVPSRLAAIHESAQAAKQRLERGAFETLTALGQCLVPGALRLLTRVAHGFPARLPLPGNLVISNVRGLSVPMYLAGARVAELYPISMLQVANGMNVTAVSHDDQVDFGFLVDSKLVGDPWVYADGVHAALRELEAAVASRSKMPDPDPDPARPASRPPSGVEERAPMGAVGGAIEADASEDEVEPLDLQLMISELGHLRAPPRPGVGSGKDDREDQTRMA